MLSVLVITARIRGVCSYYPIKLILALNSRSFLQRFRPFSSVTTISKGESLLLVTKFGLAPLVNRYSAILSKQLAHAITRGVWPYPFY